MGLYFEDFVVGAEYLTRGRTITESDIVAFAGISGDFVELHTNEAYARNGPFGRRIAHGLLTLSIAGGLTVRMNLTEDTIIAFYGIDKLRFTRPVFPGDTIHVRKRVAETTARKETAGVVTFDTTVVNQHGETVLVYRDKISIRRKG